MPRFLKRKKRLTFRTRTINWHYRVQREISRRLILDVYFFIQDFLGGKVEIYNHVWEAQRNKKSYFLIQ